MDMKWNTFPNHYGAITIPLPNNYFTLEDRYAFTGDLYLIK